MKRNLLNLMVLIILVTNFSINFACSQPQRERPIVDKEKIDNSILKYEQLFNKKISLDNMSYIKENIFSAKLMSILSEWENVHNMNLSESTELILLVDYLNSEKEFINFGEPQEKVKEAGYEAINSYLDSIISAPVVEPMDFKMDKLMGTEYSMVSSIQNKYGNIEITSVPDKADVYFDENFCGQTNDRWVIVIGDYSVSIRKEDYHSHNAKVSIKIGENPPIHCELEKKK